MTVSSTSSDPVVIDSGTDARGEFAMDLPQSEDTFVVDVAGVGSATLERNQNSKTLSDRAGNTPGFPDV
jgi:hypothetical protein